MKNLLVSLIIPVYNGERYIKNMISCLEMQTYPFVEYIFINDGSTDNSLDLLFSESSRLHDCHIYSYQNEGAASARNHGIDVAKGDLICFLDCDDEIRDNYVEKLVEPFINDSQTDISICGYEKEFLDSKNRQFKITNRCKTINKEKAIKYIFSQHHTNMIVPWAKAVRKDLFDIKFPLVRCEDEAIAYKLFLRCRKIKLIPDVLYKYIERECSDSKNDNFAKIVDICNIYYERYETLLNSRICKNIAFYEFAFTFFGFFHRISNKNKYDLFVSNNDRINNVKRHFFSIHIFKFLLLYVRYKLDQRGS